MNSFILMDGAMVHHAIRASKWFASPSPLFAPLMPKKELHLAGPILIAEDIAAEDTNKAEILRLIEGFPNRLHFAYLQSPGSLDVVAEYLRHYVYFSDETGQAYGLRIADSRVMAYLPQVLTPEQWDAISGPFAQWEVHDRMGDTYALALNESRKERTQPPQPLRLASEQIARLMDEGEPDALLDHIDEEPSQANARYMQSNHETARICIRHWEASGSANRAVLATFARLVFQSGTATRNDAARMNDLLQQAIASVR